VDAAFQRVDERAERAVADAHTATSAVMAQGGALDDLARSAAQLAETASRLRHAVSRVSAGAGSPEPTPIDSARSRPDAASRERAIGRGRQDPLVA